MWQHTQIAKGSLSSPELSGIIHFHSYSCQILSVSDDKWVFIGVSWFAVFWILFIVSHPYFVKMKRKNANSSNKLNSKKFNAFEVEKKAC